MADTLSLDDTNARSGDLRDTFLRVRSATEKLIENCSPEDCQIQSMPDASPAKWHLAHTTWFWETFLLNEQEQVANQVFDPDFNFLFNSYYEAVGPRHSRPNRGMITRPSLARVLDYRQYVTDHVVQLIDDGLTEVQNDLLRLGLAHEEQHQELLLTDFKHALWQNPLSPALMKNTNVTAVLPVEQSWVQLPEGPVSVGCDGDAFHFDNEGPAHKVYLNGGQMSLALVTEKDVADFIADDGYSTASLWLSDGWARIQQEGRTAPLYWTEREGEVMVFTLAGLIPTDDHRPAAHLDFYEANAIAEWKSARLPTEAEWEAFAKSCAAEDQSASEIEAVPSSHAPFRSVWQWTRSDYAPYPGYKAPRGAVGEYNGKFMVNQYVLRGSSCFTAPGHSRLTYRNFFPAHAQWQVSGVRLARDA